MIDIYFAGSEAFTDLVFEEPVNILMSYFYVKNKFDRFKDNLKKQYNRKVFVDSGAFTAWTRGVSIDVDAYINWVNDRDEYIDLYGQVDFIPGNISHGATKEQVEEGARKSWENYLYMRPKMKSPDKLLYTFHVGEPYSYLKQALEWKDENGNYIPYIALGGMVNKPTPVKENFLKGCFEIIKNSSNPDVKVHAFGMTSAKLLSRYPITSADSSGWIRTSSLGQITSEFGAIQVSLQKKHEPSHYIHLNPKDKEYVNKVISKFGFNLDELNKDYRNRLKYNLRYLNDKLSNIEYQQSTLKKLF